MRLLRSTTLESQEFFGSKIPPYAILSHTWEDDEVSFADLKDRQSEATDIAGYSKIRNCCKKATSDGYDWVWIDTCCIDKRSSAELSEAINAMFSWYEGAQCCYAYLADVPGGYSVPVRGPEDPFLKSRWFTRGWTLQELIAPEKVIFCSQDWTEFGTKETLAYEIHMSTGIPSSVLLNSKNLEKASVAQRMSWASRRNTTREEDIAYCLIGLFHVNIPMLYGEGNRAFERLQLEIIKTLYDQSIFAWKANRPCSDLLARSPTDFADAGDIVTFNDPRFMSPYTMTHLGILIRLPFLRSSYSNLSIACLNCGFRETSYGKQWIAIFLERNNEEDFYFRVRCDEIVLSYGPQDRKLNPRWRIRDHNYTLDDIRVFCPKDKQSMKETLRVSRGDP
jgi:hypothetical protein